VERGLAVERPAVTPGRRAARLRWGNALVVALLVGCAVVFVVPFVWLVLTALKDTAQMGAYPIQALPHPARWDNFYQALTLIDYGKYTRNTFVLAALYTVLVTITSAMAGFGFARVQGAGKRVVFIVMLATMMLPPIITTIPTYILFSRIGLIYTYWPWVLWGLGASAFLSFLFRQFFAAIPPELEDAAIVDGCGYWRIFAQIFVPLSKPVLAVSVIFSFQWVWGDWFNPSIFLSVDNTTLAVAMSGGYSTPQGQPLENVLAAGVCLYTLPVFALFFLAQRYFVQGIVTTGLKG